MDFTNTKLADLLEDKRSLPRPSRKKRYVRNEGMHKHGERRKKSTTIFDSGKRRENFEVYDAELDKWVPEKKFDKNKKVEQNPREFQTHAQRLKAIRSANFLDSYEPLSASDALLILQEKKTYYSRCKCRGKCDCEAKMKARREAKKNQIKESALVLYGKYYNTNITEPTIAEQFKKRIDYCIANERDFDFLQSNIYVELFESLINERQADYDAFISDVEPQEDDLYKEAFTDEHVNNIVDEMFASETIDNLMDKRAEEEIAYINDNYKQKLKMMGLL